MRINLVEKHLNHRTPYLVYLVFFVFDRIFKLTIVRDCSIVILYYIIIRFWLKNNKIEIVYYNWTKWAFAPSYFPIFFSNVILYLLVLKIWNLKKDSIKIRKRSEHLKGLSIILFTRLTLGNNFFTSKIDSKQSPQAGHYKSKTNLTHLFHLCKLLVLCRSRKFDIKWLYFNDNCQFICT